MILWCLQTTFSGPSERGMHRVVCFIGHTPDIRSGKIQVVERIQDKLSTSESGETAFDWFLIAITLNDLA